MLGHLHTAEGPADMDGLAGHLEGAEHEIDRGMGWISRSIPTILDSGKQETKTKARDGDNRQVAN